MPAAVTRVAVTRKVGFLNRAIEFMLDDVVTSQDASERLVLEGWVIHRSRFIEEVSLTGGSGALVSAPVELHRPGVAMRYPSSPNADRAGFRFEIPTPPAKLLELRVRLDTGKDILLATIELEARTEPRLLFMHIPKAAGSYVNRYFAQHFSTSRHAVHIESNPDWEKDPDRIRKLDFISGHVTLPRFASKVNVEDYIKVTVIREPFAQVVSHLAWIRRLADAGEEGRLANHPQYIQSFARKLAQADLASPADVREVVSGLDESENRLVENCQTRYFTPVAPGRQVSDTDATQAFEASETFDVLGSTRGIDRFLKTVAERMGWKPPGQHPPENVSRGYYGLDPTSPEHRDALHPLVSRDLALYKAISASRSLD